MWHDGSHNLGNLHRPDIPMLRAHSCLGSWVPRVLQYCSANDAERDRAGKDASMSLFVRHPSGFRIGSVWARGFKLNHWPRGGASLAC